MSLVSVFFEGTRSGVDLVQAQFEEFLAQVREADSKLQFSLLKPDALSVVVLSETGAPLLANGAFDVPDIGHLVDLSVVERVRCNINEVVVERAFDKTAGETFFIAYGSPEAGQTWQLSPEIKHTLRQPGACAIAIAARAGQGKATLLQVCESLGLTPFQSRVMTAVVETASIRQASQALGIAYATAREAVADALRATGARRLPALVDLLVTLSMGVFPRNDSSTDFVQRATGLSPRQLSMANAIANGKTRGEAALIVGVSPSVVKKEIDRIHCILDTQNAADVAKRLVEIRMLSYLTCITQRDFHWADTRPAPVRFVRRHNGSRIAYCDYGPASGRPVFVFHSSSTTQSVSRGLVRSLQDAGFRVLSVDRPGFGQSDMIKPGELGRMDCFEAAADDFAYLSSKLKLSKVAIITRGAAQVMLAIHALYPDLLDRVVMTNPDPHTNEVGRRMGLLGIVKETFFRHPELIRAFAQLIITRLTPQSAFSSLQKSFRGSPVDQITAADPDHFADYYRSVRPFAAGHLDGYIAEQTAIATSKGYRPVSATHNWTVLLCEHDVLHSPDYVRTYWQTILPEASFQTISGAGRLMTFSHPEAVVAALVMKSEHYPT
jgi:pimeloyl-ACP methyl ester carboxylesterase/DNA-binding CsgD family transcriptional regulator